MGILERPPSASAYAELFTHGLEHDPARKALWDLQRQYAYLLNNLPGVVYRCEAVLPWRMLFISKKVGDLTGRRREEFEAGFGWEEIVHPDDLRELKKIVDEAIGGAQEFTAVYRLMHTSGATKWVREQAQVIRGDDSRTYLEGFIEDITEQRGLEEVARAAEIASDRRMKALEEALENTNDCVYSLDQNWCISYLNNKAKDYFGGSQSLIGKSILDVFPDERSPFKDAFEQAMDLGQRSTVSGFLESRQSWYELRVAPTLGGITVFFRDTTEQHKLREAEQANATRWKATLNTIPQMVWSMAGGERQPDFYSDRWYEFTGLPAGSMSGREWANLYHPEDREITLARWRHCRQTGEPYETEYRVRDRHGNYRWVVSRGLAELDERGSIRRWYGTCTDVHERHLHQLTLQASERQVKEILNSIPHIIWCANERGELDFVSVPGMNDPRATSQSLLGTAWVKVVHPDDVEAAETWWAACVSDGAPYETAFRVLQPSGDYFWTLVRATPQRAEGGEIVRWFGTCTDIHEQVGTQQALEKSEQLNRGILEATPDCMSVLNAEGMVLYVNSAAAVAYGAEEAAALMGRPWVSAFSGKTGREAAGALEVAKLGGVGRLVLRGGPSGETWFDVAVAPIVDADGAPVNFVVVSHDFTERKRAEEKAQWAANHDWLTGLPNRFLFHKRFDDEASRSTKAESGFTLLLFDVDYLKNVNDGMGHDAGDALLREVAKRLQSSFGPENVVARLGGDEFGVILAGVVDPRAVEELVRAAKTRLAAPFTFNGRLVDCQGSTGASIFPLHSRRPSELMKCADLALYAAKKSAKGYLKVYEPAMRDQIRRQLSTLSLARSALGNNAVVPYYQPKISLARGDVSGFEALLRWHDHNGRMHLPRTISAAFDDAELASDISDRMIETVLDDVAGWLATGISFDHVAINAGSVELRKPNFVDFLLERMAERGVPADKIQLEVTETVFLGRGSDHIEKSLRRLSNRGVKLALDDFGTGYASLSHLNNHPVDYIKIDQSFVQGIQTGTGAEAIVEAVIGLGKSLGIQIVAEGIETPEQHRYLVGHGCQFAQGFLYSKAVAASQVPGLVKSFSGSLPESQSMLDGLLTAPNKIRAA